MMILSYIYNLFKFKKCRFMLFTGLYILCLNIGINIMTAQFSVDKLLELHKCPACYGTSACDYVRNVDITPSNILSLINYFFGVKNVFMGTYNDTKVILKKLAHTSELKKFDEMLCDNKDLQFLCDDILIRNNYSSPIDFYELVKKKVASNVMEDDNSLLTLCPSVQNIDILFHNVHITNKEPKSSAFYINLWTLVMINPEPLLLQILSAKEGWPVPKYLGSCGRVIVEEYVGLPIADYYNAPWIYRAKIALSLLNAVEMFTFKWKDFGFYLTDVSADNIAISSDGVAKFIDLENVIVVDINSVTKDKSTMFYEVQENMLEHDCLNCFSFSSVDICNHALSDHNYYAICQTLLSPTTSDTLIPGGFLHDVPRNISEQYQDLENLIEQCAVYEQSNNRINKGLRLKLLLNKIVQDNKIK